MIILYPGYTGRYLLAEFSGLGWIHLSFLFIHKVKSIFSMWHPSGKYHLCVKGHDFAGPELDPTSGHTWLHTKWMIHSCPFKRYLLGPKTAKKLSFWHLLGSSFGPATNFNTTQRLEHILVPEGPILEPILHILKLYNQTPPKKITFSIKIMK